VLPHIPKLKILGSYFTHGRREKTGKGPQRGEKEMRRCKGKGETEKRGESKRGKGKRKEREKELPGFAL